MLKTNPHDPIEPIDVDHYESPPTFQGLTKREYFAAQALKGILAAGNDLGTKKVKAARAVSYADTLVDELNQDT